MAEWQSGGERVVWESRPSAWAIVLRPMVWLMTTVVIVAVVVEAGGAISGILLDGAWAWVVIGLAVLVVLALAWSAAEWGASRYTLTERRLIWESGVLRRLRVEAPLERVQNSVMLRSVRERAFGLGTLGFATAGTDAYEVVWGMVARPAVVLARVRKELDRVQGAPDAAGLRAGEQSLMRQENPPPSPLRLGGGAGENPSPGPFPQGRGVRVIGLAGGIGAGKSEVARMLRDRGCVVLDSDGQAKALLDDPAVRDELVGWWGEKVLARAEGSEIGGVGGRGGRIDRKAVAAIVFGDPAERARLEGVIHPRLKEMRKRTIQRLSVQTPPPAAIVIDAPLLFEAGVDAECDEVVFVDSPREQRVARVKAARGWDEAELSRRESAQLPVEEKRRRSSRSVNNRGDLDDLEKQVGAVLEAIRRAAGPA